MRARDRVARWVARDPLLSELAAQSRANGLSIQLVGGAVRDVLLGRRPSDLDLIAGRDTDALLTWLAERSSHRPITFEKRGVINHRLTIDERTVDVVDRGRRRLESELTRRDFTLNAIAFDLGDQALLDPTGGAKDLRAGRLVCPRDDTFRDDPLRMLRAVRFVAQIPTLKIARATEALIRRDARRIARPSPERVRDEFDAMFLTSRASSALRQTDRLGLLTVWIPEIEPNRGLMQNEHHHLDVWEHTLDAIRHADHPRRLARGLLPSRWPEPETPATSESSDARGPLVDTPPSAEDNLLALRWSLLFHDLAKADTFEVIDGRRTFHRHEVLGSERATQIAQRLSMSKHRQRALAMLVRQHLRLVIPPRGIMSDKALSRVVRAVNPYTAVFALHSLADQAASRGVNYSKVRTKLRATVQRLLALEDEMLAAQRRGRLVDGQDVMQALDLPPGPGIGEILEQIEQLRDEGVLRTRDDAMDWLKSRAR